MNDANYPLPGDAIGAMTGKPDPHSSLPDLKRKSRISHPHSLVLKFGAATFKSAQQGRGSVRSTVPKKVLHSRASVRRFHPLGPHRNLRCHRGGSPVDFLRLEGLLRMAVSLHGD
jgi:hypothetical protein